MKKKNLLLSTLAGSMLIAGMAMPVTYAETTATATVNEEQEIVTVELPNARTQLSNDDLKELVTKAYSNHGLNPTITIEDDVVKTGSVVKVGDKKELKVVVYGDINGDGAINALDAQAIANHKTGKNPLSDLAKIAAKLDSQTDGIGALDAQRIASFKTEKATSLVDAKIKEEIKENIEPEQEVPDNAVSITKLEISTDSINEILKVTLNKIVTNSRFYVNGTYVTASSVGNVYTIKLDIGTLKTDKDNVLKVTDQDTNFEQTKSFAYRKLNAPTSVSIAPGEGNNTNMINSSNVNNAVVRVLLDENHKNTVPVTVEVTIKDSENKSKKLEYDLQTDDAGVVDIPNVDLSTFKEGVLKLEAVVKDSEGNVSKVVSTSATKEAEVPEISYISASRSNNNVIITGLTSTHSDDTIYYVIKEVSEAKPSINEILSSTTSTTPKDVSSDEKKSISIIDGNTEKAYVIYAVAKTASGTKGDIMVEINVAKLEAEKLAPVSDLTEVAGSEAVYTWNYSQENESKEGFLYYKAILRDTNNNILGEKIVKKGEEKEVSFFDEIRHQEPGTYTVEVIAVADNVNYINADTAASISTDEISSVLSEITLQPFTKDESTILKWNTVGNMTDVESFTLEVAKYNSSSAEKDKYKDNVVFTKDVGKVTKYDIAQIVEENGMGTYSFKVIANPKSTVLKASANSGEFKTSSIKYHEGEVIKDLAVSKIDGNQITLKATLLPVNAFDNKKPTYKIYYKTSEDETYGNPTVFTVPTVLILQDGTEYSFILVAEVDGKEYQSNAVTAKTASTPIETKNAVKYVKYEVESSVSSNPKLSNKQITYNGDTLYIKEDNTLHTYSAKNYEEVSDIIEVVKQLGSNDTIKINKKITSLTLTTASNNSTKTYDLSKVPADATVTITGNANYMTNVKGELNAITLNGTNAKFDIAKAKKVTVKDNNMDLTIAEGTTLTFSKFGLKATINKVVLEQKNLAKLPDITVTSTGLELPGDDTTATTKQLEIDASKIENNITVNFKSTQQKALKITGSKDYIVKLTTSSIKAGNISIISGKFDLTDENTAFTAIKVAVKSDVTFVLDVPVENGIDHVSAVLGTSVKTIVESSKFRFKAAKEESAIEYSLNKNENTISLHVPASETLTVTKVAN